MNTFSFVRPLAFGAGSLALLGASLPAFAGNTPNLVGASRNYSYTISFTTPSPFLTAGSGDVVFWFNPEPAAQIVSGKECQSALDKQA